MRCSGMGEGGGTAVAEGRDVDGLVAELIEKSGDVGGVVVEGVGLPVQSDDSDRAGMRISSVRRR